MSKDSFTCGRCKNQNTFSCTYCDGRTCYHEFPSDKEVEYHNKTRKETTMNAIDRIQWRVENLTMKQDHRNCYNELEVRLEGLDNMYLSPQDLANLNNEIERRLNRGAVAPKYVPYREYAQRRDSAFEIKDVIFNPPATIVLWKDGTKTVVKAQDGCEFDPWIGLSMAFSKKLFGNKGNYFEVFKKYCEPYEEKMNDEAIRHTLNELRNAAQKVLSGLTAVKIPSLKLQIDEAREKEEEQTIGTKVNGFTLVTEHYGYTMAYPDNFSKPEYYVCHKDEVHLIDDLNHRNCFFHSALERNAKSVAVNLELQNYILKDDK